MPALDLSRAEDAHRLTLLIGHGNANGLGPLIPALPDIAIPRNRSARNCDQRHDNSDDQAIDVKVGHLSPDETGVEVPDAANPASDLNRLNDAEPLLAFYDFPAEHWLHLKTTNPIEFTFVTVRLRTKATKRPGCRAAGLAMALKLIEAAQQRWRSVNAPHLAALVRAGATFHKGVMIERPNQQDQEDLA